MIQSLNNTPTYHFPLRDLNEPADIRRCARQNCWGAYVYVITAGNTVLKYGMSKNDGDAGDRIYRQAAHMRGWNRIFRSGAGADILITLNEHEDNIGRFVNRDDVSITVWDLGDVPIETVKRIEAELIENYSKEFGSKPIGNHKNHIKELGLRIVSKKHFNDLFVEVGA